MNITLTRTAATAAALVLGAAAATVGAGTAAAQPAVFALPACYGMGTPPVERPGQVGFQTCADGSKELTNLVWDRWGPDGATGRGLYSYQVCEPNCAAGYREEFPAVVHADEPLPAAPTSNCPAGTNFYANLIVAFPEGVPSPTQSPTNSRFRGMPAALYSTVGTDDSGFYLGTITC
ncbi:hypothetical protein ACN27E_09745 [Mycobacterium sp. WMMD1722]|uniref:hypothetical protein n=1 Tax=Mycobacterium sp. WMMD1722 TaxID=3404117 RepID=UPI003BF4896D